MHRLAVLAVAVLVVVGCAKKEDEANVPADTAQMAPEAPLAPAPISLADVSGAWNMNVMPMDRDTVLTSYQLWASDDTSAWKLKLENRTDTIQVHVLSVAGDSIVTQFGPYSSALRKNVTVLTESVNRLRDGKLVGNITAHYSVSTPDSLVYLRSEGTRAQ